MKYFQKFIFSLCLLVICTPAFAISSLDVPYESNTYHQLDLLRGWGLIDSDIQGQKPISRMEVARLIIEAEKNAEPRTLDFWEDSYNRLLKVIVRLKKDYAREIALLRKDPASSYVINGLDSLRVGYAYTDSDPRNFRPNNSTGIINAYSQSFSNFDQGRDLIKGHQFDIETIHDFQSKYVSLLAHPRFQFQNPTSPATSGSTEIQIQELAATANLKNISLSVGRFPLSLGEGENGGLLLSTHARPLDQIRLSNDHPYVLPWIFKYFGPTKLTLFASSLGPDSFFKNSLFTGYKLSIKPLPIWEFSMANAMVMGGSGAPSFGIADFLADFTGFSGTSNGKSNRIFGFDSRLRIPFLRQSELYGEMFFDDKTFASFKRTFADTAAYYGGLYIPRLKDDGRLSLRAEYRFVGEVFYHHGQFRDGYTLNRDILGDPLGPDGRQYDLDFRWDINDEKERYVNFKMALQLSDGNDYSLTGTSSTVLTNFPTEYRWRGLVSYSEKILKLPHVQFQFGMERVYNFNYVAGNDKTNVYSRLMMNVPFGDTKLPVNKK